MFRVVYSIKGTLNIKENSCFHIEFRDLLESRIVFIRMLLLTTLRSMNMIYSLILLFTVI